MKYMLIMRATDEGNAKMAGMDFGEAIKASVWPAVAPRLLLTERDAAEGKGYAAVFFDDVRLCVRGRPHAGGTFGVAAELPSAALAVGVRPPA